MFGTAKRNEDITRNIIRTYVEDSNLEAVLWVIDIPTLPIAWYVSFNNGVTRILLLGRG